MGINITYRKEFDENGNEKMVEVSREVFDDPTPLVDQVELLEQKVECLINELQEVLLEIKKSKNQ